MRVVRAGHFFNGQLAGNWECEPPDLVKVTEDKRVMVGEIEIVPWTRILKVSAGGKKWMTIHDEVREHERY